LYRHTQIHPEQRGYSHLILVDDLGWTDLGCQGSTFYETPVIDRLAREGMRFTDAYANCPVCSPARAALMTGRYSGRVGFTGHITAIGRHRYRPHGRIIPPDDYLFLRHEETTLAEALRPAGYVSASIGKWHLGSESYWPKKQGFDVNVAGYDHGSPPSYFYPYENPGNAWNPKLLNLPNGAPGEYLTDRLTGEAIRFVEENRDRPFFLYLPHYAVHTPLEAPEDLVRKYEKKLKRDHSQINATYAAMIEKVDQSVGRILAVLSKLGLAKDTLVILTSDNGGALQATRNLPLRLGKGHVYEGGIRVPLIVRWPGRVAPGSTSSLPATGADLYPTITTIAGVNSRPAKVLDGVSLVPELTGEGAVAPRDLFWYYPHYSPQGSSPGAVIRSGDYKLIQIYDPPGVELYNLATDIGETKELSESMPDKTKQLHGRLNKWLHQTVAIQHKLNPAYDPELAARERPQ
jgi:arylsulfatase A-like enzyme